MFRACFFGQADQASGGRVAAAGQALMRTPGANPLAPVSAGTTSAGAEWPSPPPSQRETPPESSRGGSHAPPPSQRETPPESSRGGSHAPQPSEREIPPESSRGGSHAPPPSQRETPPESSRGGSHAPSTPVPHVATRLKGVKPDRITVCEPRDLVYGLTLRQKELGRGTYGIVVEGTYRGVACAVKVMLSQGLDRAALRELLVGPSLVHPHVIPTFMCRCAHLTHEFFDLLEGKRLEGRDLSLPRALEAIPLVSDDGFGDPGSGRDGSDPLLVLHQVLHALEAKASHMAVVTVQQFCNRGTLEVAIRRGIFRESERWNDRVARRALLRTAIEMARGLLHLHDAGIVHGDLKPANILLHSSRDDRRGFTAKVADFGLSHVLPLNASSVQTESWGSIAYMAPEAFCGKVSRATDVWAFGVMLWEMVTGKRPYEGMRQPEVVLGVGDGSVVLRWPQGTGDPLVRLGRSCLSYLPDRRPDFEAVAEALVGIERGIRAELLAPRLGAGEGGAPRSRASTAASGEVRGAV